MMKRTMLVLGFLIALAGCRDGQFIKKTFTSSCGGGGISLNGYTATIIRYGDSRMRVIPISKVRPETEFRFVLRPKVQDSDPPIVYKDAWVRIESDDDDAEGNWLEAEGTYNGTGKHHTLVACVPKREELTKERYKYKVTVSYPDKPDTINYIDPRIDINN